MVANIPRLSPRGAVLLAFVLSPYAGLLLGRGFYLALAWLTDLLGLAVQPGANVQAGAAIALTIGAMGFYLASVVYRAINTINAGAIHD